MKNFCRIFIVLSVIFFTYCSCNDTLYPVFIPSEEGGTPEGTVNPNPGDNTGTGENNGSGTTSPLPTLGTADYSKLTASNHPRVIFSNNDFETIKSGSGGAVFNTIHNLIISKANTYINATELTRVLNGKRMLDVSRRALERLTYCAYAYKTTGDSQYLTRAEKDLKAVCAFQDWNARSHYLDVGEMSAGVALAYDWLYSDLQADTKQAVRKALENFAFTTAQNKVWNLNFYNAASNWNQVCNGGLIAAALAVYEDNPTQAKEIIEKGVESNLPAMSEMYSPDGAYPEGYSYWSYGTIYQALILTALETATGSDLNLSKVEGFSKTSKYVLFMEGYLDMCFNYSDSTPPVVPGLALWYFAYKYNDTSLLYIEKNRLNKYSSAGESRLLPLVAYYAYKLNLSSLDEIKAPSEKIYKGGGLTPVVLVHDNWAMDVTDKFLGIKGGKANTSHGHMDAGSFVYEAFGERWADDMSRPSYGVLEQQINLWDMNDGSERWDVIQYNNKHHNTLTVNGKYHKVAGMAEIKGTVNSNGRKGGTVDITAPLNEVESAVRTIYMEGDNLIVTDEIKAKPNLDAQIQWTMVTKAVPNQYASVIELKSAKGKYMYMKKSSSTGHNPAWWYTDKQVISGYYECGYKITIKAGTSAKITITLTPNE